MQSEITKHLDTEKALIGCLLVKPDKLADIAGIVRLEDMLSKEAIPALDVEIMCVLGDTEGFALALQLKDVFEQAGWKVNGVSQGVFTAPIKHLELSFGKQPSREIQQALAPLFDNFDYPREARLNKQLQENALKIVVGAK